MTTTTAHAPLTWVSLNLEFGGLDYTPAAPNLRRCGSYDLTRLNQLPELVTFTGHAPDIIFFQEGRLFDANGAELLHYTERLLRTAKVGTYRGLLGRSLHNDLHQVIYVNTQRVEVVRHWQGVDPNEGTRRLGFAEVVVDGDEDRSIMLRSIHLDPRDGDARLALMKFIGGAVGPTQRGLMAGDFNSITSRRTRRQGEPQRRFLAMSRDGRFSKGYWPPRHRWWWTPWQRRKLDTLPDTRALDYLIDIGWFDQAIIDNNTTPTIHPKVDRGGEIIIDRCLTHGPLHCVPGSFQVDTVQRGASDHRGLAGAVTIE